MYGHSALMMCSLEQLTRCTLGGLRLSLLSFGFGLRVLGGLWSFKAGVLELLEEQFWVVVRAGIVILVLFLTLEHALNEAWSLDSIVVFLSVLVDDAARVVLLDVHLDLDLLVEAHVAVIANEAVEGELAGATEALLHLELANVAAVLGLEALDLDHVLLGLGVHDDDVPVGLAHEWVVLRMDVSWALVLRQVVVGDSDLESDDVAACDDLFAFDSDRVCNSDQRHDLDDFLKLGKLCLISTE